MRLARILPDGRPERISRACRSYAIALPQDRRMRACHSIGEAQLSGAPECPTTREAAITTAILGYQLPLQRLDAAAEDQLTPGLICTRPPEDFYERKLTAAATQTELAASWLIARKF